MFGLAVVDGLHIEGVPKDEGNALRRAAISQPGPGEETFNAHDQIAPLGGNGLETRVWPGRPIPVDKDLPVMVHDTHVHGPCMQIDATVKVMSLGVESHEVSSSS
jgi:hypothetical protein